jgi:hypothetical protein
MCPAGKVTLPQNSALRVDRNEGWGIRLQSIAAQDKAILFIESLLQFWPQAFVQTSAY